MSAAAEKQTPAPWRLSDDNRVRRVVKGGSGKQERTVCIIERWTSEPDALLLGAAAQAVDALEAEWRHGGCIGCTTDGPYDHLPRREAIRAYQDAKWDGRADERNHIAGCRSAGSRAALRAAGRIP